MPLLQAEQRRREPAKAGHMDFQRVLRMRVPIVVRLAERKMPLSEVMRLGAGAIIEFVKGSGERSICSSTTSPSARAKPSKSARTSASASPASATSAGLSRDSEKSGRGASPKRRSRLRTSCSASAPVRSRKRLIPIPVESRAVRATKTAGSARPTARESKRILLTRRASPRHPFVNSSANFIASSRVPTRPSNWASYTASNTRLNTGPGFHPTAVRSSPVMSGGGA